MKGACQRLYDKLGDKNFDKSRDELVDKCITDTQSGVIHRAGWEHNTNASTVTPGTSKDEIKREILHEFDHTPSTEEFKVGYATPDGELNVWEGGYNGSWEH